MPRRPSYPTRLFFENGILYVNSAIGTAQISDGTSNVFLVGETRFCNTAAGSIAVHNGSTKDQWCWASTFRCTREAPPTLQVPWPSAVVQINYPPLDVWDPTTSTAFDYPMLTFSSFHPGGCHVMMGDASVHFANENMDLLTFRELGARNDGEPLGGAPL